MRIIQDGVPLNEKPSKWISPIDGKVFVSEAEMNEYLKINFADQVFKDDALDEEIVKKRGPGRPPKEKQ